MRSVAWRAIATSAVFLSACSTIWPLKPVATEWPLLGSDLQVTVSGTTQRVVLYNNSSQLQHGTSNTTRLDVWINGRGVGGLDIGDYVQLALTPGEYTLEVLHHDAMDFKSTHVLKVGQQPVYVELSATLTKG